MLAVRKVVQAIKQNIPHRGLLVGDVVLFSQALQQTCRLARKQVFLW